MQQMKGSTKRSKNTVLVIQDDFASAALLDYIETGAYDIIFHQAAIPQVGYSVDYPYETTINNVSKTVGLFNAAQGNVKRIINASSSSVYGLANSLPTKENENKNPMSPYAWQKSAIEDYSKICWGLYKLDIVNLRYFNVFGPGQYGNSAYSTAVSAWCNAIKNGLECRSDGDGEQTRDMCYVDNIVHANIAAADLTKPIPFRGLSYNVACGESVSNNEILNYLKEKFNDRVKVVHAPERQGDVKHTLADIHSAQKDFNYQPRVSFWEGLDRTIEWWGLNSHDDNK
jgi:UDP-glucose 4-epimerase